jgi:glutathione S-transferase
MALELYGHPFSSYCQKALVALYEAGTGFTFRQLDGTDPSAFEMLRRLWPIGKFPLLVDEGWPVAETTVIIEHLDLHHPGPEPMIPHDPAQALEARFMDRVFDNYIQTPFQRVVGDALRPETARDPHGVAEARAALERAYGWLDGRMEGRAWAAGERFGLADCSAAPALFYTDWVHPIPERFVSLRAYRARLNARPSFARCIEEARPFRPLFPLGAPDRD